MNLTGTRQRTGWRHDAHARRLVRLALICAVCVPVPVVLAAGCARDSGPSATSREQGAAATGREQGAAATSREQGAAATGGERGAATTEARRTEDYVAVTGIVTDEDGPIADAVVRVQTTSIETHTDALGRFALDGVAPSDPVTLTAWAQGYFIGHAAVGAGTEPVSIVLEPHAETDNPSYAWVSAFSTAGDEANCENCHSEPGNPQSSLPFDEWARDAHARSAENVRFLTMYTGTDVHGNQSPFARFGESRRFAGTDPLVPEPGQPYYGPGFKLDYPYLGGSCSACHVPAGEFTSTYGVDPTAPSGVGAEGATCDLCHKIWDVRLEPDTGLPHRDLPGILSYEFRRPPEGHQFFAGPLVDVAPGEDTYSPLQRESAYCAACHYGVFWDTTVYNSYGEWLDSPYSDPESGRTCQDCHMPSGAAERFALAEKGGLRRDPNSIVTHLMRGVTDEDLMRTAVSLQVDARRQSSHVYVDVRVTNNGTGHHVPTDSPLRHLILLVEAKRDDGYTLAQVEGPTVPVWGGIGDPAGGYYAGLPGTAYAKVLQEFRSELFPTGAYWNPTRVLSDNRIPALATDTTSYAFLAPESGDVIVDVELLFRRAYRELADQKGWSDPDLVMARRSTRLTERW